MKNEGLSIYKNYCENGFCVLKDILRETIRNISKKLYNAKGSCGKNKVCVHAYYYFDCYVEATKFLGFSK
jgi:hypothetical protein